MTYNLDEIVSRTNTYAIKWEMCEEGVIPLWVADMDFKTAPAVTDALVKRARHGIFGYTKPSLSYYRAVCGWFKKRHGFDVRPGWILQSTGVVPALSNIIEALTEPGDGVLIQPPVYNCFFSCVKNAGRELVFNPLINENGVYRMDYEDLGKKAADPRVKLFLLCSPHNPAGRVWTAEELRRAGEICVKHNVLVVADEIHCELLAPGVKFTPFASLCDEFLQNSVTCNSPSKAFNLAGLRAANIFVSDKERRDKINRQLALNEINVLSPFGVEGVIAAYNAGADWLDALNGYLHENFECLRAFFAERLPKLRVTPLEGTYLAWVDCSALKRPSAELAELLLTQGKVRVNAGSVYGQEGEYFLRINIACPRAMLKEGLERIARTLQDLA